MRSTNWVSIQFYWWCCRTLEVFEVVVVVVAVLVVVDDVVAVAICLSLEQMNEKCCFMAIIIEERNCFRLYYKCVQDLQSALERSMCI